MKKLLLSTCFLTLGLGGVSVAQNYAPVPVTGFTEDVVAEGTGTVASVTTDDVDGASFNLVAQNFVNPSGQSPTSGLPNSGTINSAATSGLTYQLASYNSNNSLQISGTGTGSLTFVTPQSADQVYVLVTSGSGISSVNMTVNFTDGTSQAFNGQSVSDWYNGSGYAIQGISRVSRSTNQIENSSTNPRLYQKLLTISAANSGKSIQSVSFTKTSTTGVLNVMGISVRTVPSSLANDAGVIAVTAPSSGCTLSNQEVITVTLKNFGTATQSNIPVSYSINGATAISEVFAGPLAGNTTTSYSFTATVDLSATGTYSIQAYSGLTGDAAAVNDTISRTITLSTAPAAPTVTTSGSTSICAGSSVTLTASSSGSGITYQWYKNGTLIANATAATYAATTGGSYTAIASLNGCNSPASAASVLTVNANPSAPNVSFSSSLTFCAGDSVVLTASSSVTGATYTWFKDGNVIPGATSATYSAKTVGNYAASLTSNNCSSPLSTPINIFVHPNPATPTITLSGNTLTSSSANGNQWYKDGILIAGAVNRTYTTAGNGTYTVKVTANGCSSLASNAIVIGTTGIAGDLNELKVTVFPNPSTGNFTIEIPKSGSFELKITDLTGKVLKHQKIEMNKTTIEMGGVSNGVYLLQVISGGKTTVQKLLIE